MNELRQAVAMLFSRKGRPSMSERDFVLMASMDFRWFPPKEAQKLLDIAVKTSLVTRKDGEISPNFDLKSVEIPLDFSPGLELLNEKPEQADLFTLIVEKMVTESQIDKKALISKINAVQTDMDITIEVAALIVGRELGVDLSSFYSAVKERLQSFDSPSRK